MVANAKPAAKKTWIGGDDSYVGASYSTRTDGKGRFHIANVTPGVYDVYGVNTPYLLGEARKQETVQGGHREVGLTVPRGATLEVTLTGLGDELPDGFGVYVQTDAKSLFNQGSMGGDFRDLRTGQAQLDLVGPGKWLGRDLPSGPARVFFGRSRYNVVEPGGWSSPKDGYIEPLGEVVLKTDSTARLKADISSRLPGAILVTVYTQGEVTPQARLWVYTEGRVAAGTAKSGDDGSALIDGLFPGTYSIEVSLPKGNLLTHENLIQVSAGNVNSVSFTSFQFPNTLRCLGPNGDPLPQANLYLKSPSMSIDVRTDADGEVDALLHEGRFEVRYDSYDATIKQWSRLKGILVWPAADGEVVEVHLARE